MKMMIESGLRLSRTSFGTPLETRAADWRFAAAPSPPSLMIAMG